MFNKLNFNQYDKLTNTVDRFVTRNESFILFLQQLLLSTALH